MDSKNISPISKILAYTIMLIFTVLTIYPIFWLFIQSFKTNMDYNLTSKLAFPTTWYFGNYPRVWSQPGLAYGFTSFFKNSLIYTTITVSVVVLLANMAGFAFAKLHFKITKVLHSMFIIGILLTIQSILIPLYVMILRAGLFDTRLGILIPYIGLGLPMGIYLFTDFIRRGIPNELIESSKIDGATYLRVFTRIVFPMCAPVSVTLAIISFTGTWNEFILMSLLTRTDKYKSIPAMVGRYAGSLGSDWGQLFTSLSLSIIPLITFYLIFRNQITKGVSAGAVKG